MARPRNEIPNLRWDNSSGQWVCYIDRKRIRLGSDRIDAERQRLALIAGVPVDLLGHSAGSRVIGTYVEDSILRAAQGAKKIG